MENEITPNDELNAENELLKLKLEMEHGMSFSETGNLSPQIENDWLNYVNNFEKAHKDAGRITVAKFIGNPIFPLAETLSSDQLSAELDRLFNILSQHGIGVDFLSEYEDNVIYKFIVEELFAHEIDDIRIPGMTCNFIYEEFHPNHDYDLRRLSAELMEQLLTKKWVEEFTKYILNSPVMWRDKEYDEHGISEIILAFQESHKTFEIEQQEISNVRWNLEEANGLVTIQIVYKAHRLDGSVQVHSGEAHIQFKYEWNWWSITGFSLPGL